MSGWIKWVVIIHKEVKKYLFWRKTQFLDAIFSLQRQFLRLCCYFYFFLKFGYQFFYAQKQLAISKTACITPCSVSNWWIVIGWLLTVSFSSANLNFKPSISSQFSCAYVLVLWAVVSTAFSLRWMSFVT